MPAPRPDPTAAVARWLPRLVALSGAAALVYESVWMRSFGLIFGGTTTATAMVLAVYMGGLALGSALAARRPARDPLRAYGRVELAVSATALLTLPLLSGLPWAYGALVARANLPDAVESVGAAALAAVVLLPATILLGTTVPLALEFLARAGVDVHGGFGRLYLLNTLGGALGVAVAPFVLVPALGVRGTLVTAAVASAVVGMLALRWSRSVGAPVPRIPPPESAVAPVQPPGRELLAGMPLLAAASGAATFGVEVLWTRSYALVIGSSVYAFNLMLLAVLVGIALGSAVYGRVRRRIARPVRAVGLLFAVAGLAVLAGQWAIGFLPIAYLAALGWLPVSFGAHQVAGFALCLGTMLPVTVVLGLTFPLLLHLADVEEAGAQKTAGRLYAWNTAGAIAGALATDLLLVPRLGIQPPYMVFAALLLAGGAWATAASTGPALVRRSVAAAALLVGLVALAPRWAPWDPVLMTSGVHRYGLEWTQQLDSAAELATWLREQRTLLFYREGREAVIAVAQPVGSGRRRFLSINGKTDAGSGAEDVVQQKFIAHVPMLLHPAPRRVLVVGWGSGATAASAAVYPVQSIECVEIEPAQWDAAPLFADLNGRLRGDPRFRMVFRDARNYILRSRHDYDVIVSEPSNAWLSGASNLFTREFQEAAKAHLARGGVFAQWFHYYSLEPSDVKVEIRTFLSVFPNASLWLAPPVGPEQGVKNLAADLLLVGSTEPQRLDWERLERAFADPGICADLRATGVFKDASTLLATWTMGRPQLLRWSEDRQAFPAGTPLNTDDHPYIEFMAPRGNVMAPSRASRLAVAQYSAMAREGGDVRDVVSGAPSGGPAEAEFLRELAARYASAVQPERAVRALDLARAADPRDAALPERAGELLLETGRPAEAESRFREAVRIDPDRRRAWEALGDLALDRHDYVAAEKAHRALLRLDPRNVDAWLRLGAVLARQERWREAREALVRGLALDPKAPVDRELLGFLERRAAESAGEGR